MSNVKIPTSTPLTPKILQEAAELMKNKYGFPDSEFEVHHPECPKFLTKGVKACRCGNDGVGWIFEDELEKGGK